MYNRFFHIMRNVVPWIPQNLQGRSHHSLSLSLPLYLSHSPECCNVSAKCTYAIVRVHESAVSTLLRATSCILQRIYKRARIKRFRFSARNTRHVKKYLFSKAQMRQIAYPAHKFQASKTLISDFIQKFIILDSPFKDSHSLTKLSPFFINFQDTFNIQM